MPTDRRRTLLVLVLSVVLLAISLTAPLPSGPSRQLAGDAGEKPPVPAEPAAGQLLAESPTEPAGPPVEPPAGPLAEPLAQPPPAGSMPGEAPPAERRTIPYRIELRTTDPAVADALTIIPAVLEDPRGWSRAGFDFVLDPAAPFAIVIAEGADAQVLCQPYDVGGRFSCQNGPLVVLNAIRWREGVSHWPADLASYRTMLVNHEVGHLLGMHHLRCQAPGQPAPVMEQQSGTLRGCQANPWPTAIEVRLAASGQFILAPPPLDVPFPP
ncbi:DUF3152 domain-containing protein [soil metagenome]